MQMRHQSACERHEDLIENTTTFLLDFQAQFHLRTKPGFPFEVGGHARPCSEFGPSAASAGGVPVSHWCADEQAGRVWGRVVFGRSP